MIFVSIFQLAEMVNIHFLSLMEALQECNSTVLSKVSTVDWIRYEELYKWASGHWLIPMERDRQIWSDRCDCWVLHIAKVRSIPSPYLGIVEMQKSWRWPFFFFQNSFIFRFCFGLKVSTDFPKFSKILCSFVTKRTIICLKKSWWL